jgi:hypothetical protein
LTFSCYYIVYFNDIWHSVSIILFISMTFDIQFPLYCLFQWHLTISFHYIVYFNDIWHSVSIILFISMTFVWHSVSIILFISMTFDIPFLLYCLIQWHLTFSFLYIVYFNDIWHYWMNVNDTKETNKHLFLQDTLISFLHNSRSNGFLFVILYRFTICYHILVSSDFRTQFGT